MKNEIVVAAAGLGALLLPRTASAQWYSEFSPYPRSYAVDPSYPGGTNTGTALTAAAGTWNNLFSGQGWGSNWMAPGSGDVTIQFRSDYAAFNAPGGGCAGNGTTGHLVCDPFVANQDTNYQQQMFTHEFGHMFGATDDETPYDTVMSNNPVWTNDFTGEDYYCFEYYWGFEGS